jgi:16S rRNA processing protein RimM
MMPIAQVLKSYGTEGEVVVNFLSDMTDDIDLKEPIFLIFDELSVPFFICSLEGKGGKRAKLKIEDIDTLKEAEEIVGKKIFIPCSSTDEDNDFFELVGYTLFDQNNKKVGVISQINDFSGNICVEVDGQLYPLHDDLIISIDEDKLFIFITIAEGY